MEWESGQIDLSYRLLVRYDSFNRTALSRVMDFAICNEEEIMLNSWSFHTSVRVDDQASAPYRVHKIQVQAHGAP